MVKNTMNLVRKAKFVIDTKYDIYANNVDDINRESDSTFDMILNGFNFGYMQGMKAARAERKKCGACHEQKRENGRRFKCQLMDISTIWRVLNVDHYK